MGLQGQIKNLKQLQILWVILGLSCGIAVVGPPRCLQDLGEAVWGEGKRAEVDSQHLPPEGHLPLINEENKAGQLIACNRLRAAQISPQSAAGGGGGGLTQLPGPLCLWRGLEGTF